MVTACGQHVDKGMTQMAQRKMSHLVKHTQMVYCIILDCALNHEQWYHWKPSWIEIPLHTMELLS